MNGHSVAAAFLIAAWATLPGCVGPDVAPGEEFDAGSVFASTTPVLSHQFLVRNTTLKTVAIVGEDHSCSCTTIEVEKKRLAPGETATLTMSVKVPSTYSNLFLTCQLKTDHPQFPEWSYHLKLESFPRARIVPDSIELEASEVPGGTGREGGPSGEAWAESFARDGEVPLAPTGIDHPEGLRVRLEDRPKIETVARGVVRARYRIELAVEGAALVGTHSLPLNVRFGEGVTAGTMVVSRRNGRIECVPAQMHFGLVLTAQAVTTRKVLVRSRDGTPFRLMSVRADMGCVDAVGAALPSGPAPSHNLELRFSAPGEISSTALSGNVWIDTDVATLPVVTLPWSVFFSRSAQRPEVGATPGPTSTGSGRPLAGRKER
jgi:hypothetical protein